MWPHIENMEDYKHYVKKVEECLEMEQIETLNPVIDEETGEITSDEFSWEPCECCGRELGGVRVEADAYSRERGEIVGPFYICWDCLYFLEYGQLDDQTMLEIKGE